MKENNTVLFLEAITNDDQDIKQILTSGRSYQKHEESENFSIPTEKAEENTKTHMERELKGVCKPRNILNSIK